MSSETLDIPTSTIEYRLDGGYVRHWLVAGPAAQPVPDLSRFPGTDFKQQIADAYYQSTLEIDRPPAELTTATIDVGDDEPATVTWRVVHTEDDRFVDVSAFYHTCHHLRTWAYCQLDVPEACEKRFILTTNGPADLWLNGEHVHRHAHFHHQIPASVAFPVALSAGRNEIMVRFEGVAVRECPYVMALQVTDQIDADWTIHLPSTIEPLKRRQVFEEFFSHAYLPRAVYYREDVLDLHWAEELPYRLQINVRLRALDGRIYSEGQPTVSAGDVNSLGRVYQVPSGDYELILMPQTEEYYIKGMRVERRLPLRIVNDRYSDAPYGTYTERRIDALTDATRRKGNVFAEIAKMALAQWDKIDPDVILQTVGDINRRADCSDFYLVGLLGMMIRYLDDPAFPTELRPPLEDCVLGFRYWMDEPGNDAMCFWSENHQILFHTCAVLAGQLYPEAIFTNTGETGAWHRQKGERMALSWLRKRAAGGFREWDSNTYFEEDVLALSHLADLAEDEEVLEMAAVVMDKLFFTMAVNSFRGAFGSTHGRTYSPYIKSARTEPTSGIGRLLWGMGNFNERILGTVSLACAESYELPSIIAAVAADNRSEMWNREQHAGTLEQWCDLAEGDWAVNKVTYRTPDYMLSSVQDYQPGAPGYQQHVWQATFGPDAVVFVTHPPCAGEDGSHRPNFWHGNVTLPRVAQWKDTLIAVHNFAPDDWMGFTHAYFPRGAFDETVILDEWAFARLGDGYLALAAAQGLQPTTRGLHAYQEIRSYGHQNTWLCLMGRAAVDGAFADFQRRVVGLEIRLSPLGVQGKTLRGERIAFGWDGPLTVDGREQPITGFLHYENPYSIAELNAETMPIGYGQEVMQLRLV